MEKEKVEQPTINNLKEDFLNSVSAIMMKLKFNSSSVYKISIDKINKITTKSYIVDVAIIDFADGKTLDNLKIYYYDSEKQLDKFSNDNELNSIFTKTVDDILLKADLNHEKIDQYFLISDQIPSAQEVRNNRVRFSTIINHFLKKAVAGKLVEMLDEKQSDASRIYGIQFAFPTIELTQFPDKGYSTIGLEAKMIDNETLDVMTYANVSNKIKYIDYENIGWIYQTVGNFKFGEDYHIDAINKYLTNNIKEKKIPYKDYNISLLRYNGLLRKTDEYIIDKLGNTERLDTIKRMYNMGMLDDLIDDLRVVSDTLLSATLKSQIGSSTILVLLMGENGILSSYYGPIYKVGSQEAGSLKKAAIKIENVIGYTSSISTLLAVYDGRKKTEVG